MDLFSYSQRWLGFTQKGESGGSLLGLSKNVILSLSKAALKEQVSFVFLLCLSDQL